MKEKQPFEFIIMSVVKEGPKTRFLELQVVRGTERYLLNIADSEYIQTLREFNRTLEPEFREPENILELESLDPFELVRQQISELPEDTLDSYIEPIPKEE